MNNDQIGYEWLRLVSRANTLLMERRKTAVSPDRGWEVSAAENL
jgi:hypothetical protein